LLLVFRLNVVRGEGAFCNASGYKQGLTIKGFYFKIGWVDVCALWTKWDRPPDGLH